jgi:cysteine rich repeat protein
MMDQTRRAAYEVSLSCQADVFSWCQGIAPGQGRLVACLLSHRSDLSSTCQEAITSVKELQSACGGDLAQMCSGVPAGGGQRLACLFAQKGQLSEGCRSFLEQGR